MRPLIAMIVANLKMTVRNRGAIFWNLLFPAIFIVIFGMVFGGDQSLVINVGVTGDGSTALVELNDFCCLGNYGLRAVDYARCIAERWGDVWEEFACLPTGTESGRREILTPAPHTTKHTDPY